MGGGTYSLKSLLPKERFFEKVVMAIFDLLSEFLPQIGREKTVEKIFFMFCFAGNCLTCYLNRSLTSNNTTLYLQDYADFNNMLLLTKMTLKKLL